MKYDTITLVVIALGLFIISLMTYSLLTGRQPEGDVFRIILIPTHSAQLAFFAWRLGGNEKTNQPKGANKE